MTTAAYQDAAEHVDQHNQRAASPEDSQQTPDGDPQNAAEPSLEEIEQHYEQRASNLREQATAMYLFGSQDEKVAND